MLKLCSCSASASKMALSSLSARAIASRSAVESSARIPHCYRASWIYTSNSSSLSSSLQDPFRSLIRPMSTETTSAAPSLSFVDLRNHFISSKFSNYHNIDSRVNSRIGSRTNSSKNSHMSVRSYHSTSLLLGGRHGGSKSAELASRGLSKQQKKRRKAAIVEKAAKRDPAKEKLKDNTLKQKIDSFDLDSFIKNSDKELDNLSNVLSLPMDHLAKTGQMNFLNPKDDVFVEGEGEVEMLRVDASAELEKLEGAYADLISKRSPSSTSSSARKSKTSSAISAIDVGSTNNKSLMLTNFELSKLSINKDIANAAILQFAKSSTYTNVERTMHVMNSLGLPVAEESYVAVMKMYNRNKMYDNAQKTFEKIISSGQDPSMNAWESLVLSKAKTGDYAEATNIISRLKKLELTPTIGMFVPLQQHLLEKKKWDELRKLWNDMHLELIDLNLHSFHIMLKQCIQTNEVERALFYYDELLALKIKPTTETFFQLFRACAGAPHYVNGYHDIIFDTMALMESAEITPTVPIYNSIIYAFAKSCDSVAAEFYYWEMRRKGLEPNEGTYTALFHAYARANAIGNGKLEYKGRYVRIPERNFTPEEQAFVDVGKKVTFELAAEGITNNGVLERGRRQSAPTEDILEDEEALHSSVDQVMNQAKEARKAGRDFQGKLENFRKVKRLEGLKYLAKISRGDNEDPQMIQDISKLQLSDIKSTANVIDTTSSSSSSEEVSQLLEQSDFKSLLGRFGLRAEDEETSNMLKGMSDEEINDIKELMLREKNGEGLTLSSGSSGSVGSGMTDFMPGGEASMSSPKALAERVSEKMAMGKEGALGRGKRGAKGRGAPRSSSDSSKEEGEGGGVYSTSDANAKVSEESYLKNIDSKTLLSQISKLQEVSSEKNNIDMEIKGGAEEGSKSKRRALPLKRGSKSALVPDIGEQELTSFSQNSSGSGSKVLGVVGENSDLDLSKVIELEQAKFAEIDYEDEILLSRSNRKNNRSQKLNINVPIDELGDRAAKNNNNNNNNVAANNEILGIIEPNEELSKLEYWKFLKLDEKFDKNFDVDGFLNDANQSAAVKRFKEAVSREKENEKLKQKSSRGSYDVDDGEDEDEVDDEDFDEEEIDIDDKSIPAEVRYKHMKRMLKSPDRSYNLRDLFDVKQEIEAGHLVALESMMNSSAFADPFLGNIPVEAPATQVSKEYRGRKYITSSKTDIINLLDSAADKAAERNSSKKAIRKFDANSSTGNSGRKTTSKSPMKQSEKAFYNKDKAYLANIDSDSLSPENQGDALWDKLEYGRAPNPIYALPLEYRQIMNIKRSKLAFSEFQRNPSMKVTNHVLNTYLQVYSEALKVDSAMNVFESFKTFDLAPDTKTYKALIRMFIRTDNVDRALELKKEQVNSLKLTPEGDQYGLLIESLVVNNKIVEAFKELECAAEKGVAIPEKNVKFLRRAANQLGVRHPDMPEDPYEWVRSMKDARKKTKISDRSVQALRSQLFS